MTFDLSRIRFDARKDFLGVVMQQGRVQLDSDWNEWVAQLSRRLQTGTLDMFNGSVVPRVTPDGFLITLAGGTMSIGAGRIYVDGLLAENHGGLPLAWNPSLAELTGTAPLDFATQPYLRHYPSDEFSSASLPEGGQHLVYVDVWQRDVSAIEQPDLIETALGVDTTGRRQTVWQVKVLEGVGNISRDTPDEDIPGWREATEPSAARLSVGVGAPPDEEENPCLISPTAGYRGLENQLYRVEVHTGGPLGKATFKWSRDNATVASRVTHINPARDRITVESIGRDDLLRFNDGDWVEITDDWRELNNLPGDMRRIKAGGGVDEVARTLAFDTPLPAEPASINDSGNFPVGGNNATDPARNTRVRRWDHAGQVRREDGGVVQNLNDPGSNGEIVIPPAAIGLFIEHGIVVHFDLNPDADLHPSGGEFKSGDYWVFAARSADASVELLDRAAPLGTHHHYARLARVRFPNDETDFRTLWPAIVEAGDGDCGCSVCVTAEGHNSGTATIQQAIDSIKDTGGTVCLGIGSYNLDRPLDVIDARSLTIRGQGWATSLVGTEPGSILNIDHSKSVTLELFTVIASAGKSGVSSVVAVRNSIDFKADHINVLGLAVDSGTSIGIGLSGVMLGVDVSHCAIIAERGIAVEGSGKVSYALIAELSIEHNLFFCSQRAINFDEYSLHFGSSCINANLMLTGSDVAIVVTGAVLQKSQMLISENTILSSGDGIRAGVDCLTIKGNKISGTGRQSGNAIVLQQGLYPVSVDQLIISENRLSEFGGNAIAINCRFETISISENMIKEMGLGALVMSQDGAAERLSFNGNECHQLGLLARDDNTAFAAVQLIRVARSDLLNNVIAGVALQSISSPAVDALRTAAIGQLHVAGNRFFGIGPDRLSSVAGVNAAHCLPPFDRFSFENNSIERLGDENQKPTPINWQAINIMPDAVQVRYFAEAHFILNEKGGEGYLLTATGVDAVDSLASSVAIRGNYLRAHLTNVALNQSNQVGSLLFSENHCEVTGEGSKAFLLGDFRARTINVSNNHLIGARDRESMILATQIKRAIVIGNTATGPIVVQGDAVPLDINLTNIIGF